MLKRVARWLREASPPTQGYLDAATEPEYGVLAAWGGGIVAAAALAMCVGIAASSGKLAFDSVVQRDAPDANRGRSFARFETRFQLTWVVGAFLPVVISIPMEVGFIVIAACAAFALF